MRTSDWILLITTGLLCGVSYVLMRKDLKEYCSKQTDTGELAADLTRSKVMVVFSVLMTLLTLGIAVTFGLIYKSNSFCFSLKRLSLLALIWPLAYIDYKTYRIPNRFVILGLIYRGLILILELFLEYNGVWSRLLMEVIATAALLLAAFLCTLLMKNSIGFGDIKLFAVMGLMLGLRGIWSAIFLSLLFSFILSVILIITKKKTRKDVIPFAPAIVFGTFLSVFLTGM